MNAPVITFGMVEQYANSLRGARARRHIRHFYEFIQPLHVPTINWHHVKLLEKLDLFVQGKIKKMMVFMPPQHGKFLKGDTPVLTTKGWKQHNELNVGDYVFNDHGKPVAVLANSGTYNWHVNKVTFAGGEVLYAANEHVWKVHIEKDDHKGRYCTLADTATIKQIKHRRAPFIQCAPSLDTEEKQLLIDPYLLGVWLGDGTSANNGITCGTEDISHFMQFGKAASCKGATAFRIGVKGLCKPLRLMGLKGNKHIPLDYMLSSREQRMELLRGLMDTDGSCDKKGRCEFTQMEGKLAEDVYTLLRSLGYKATKNTYDAKLNGKTVGKKCRIAFSPNKGDVIFKLQRKQERIDTKKQGDRADKYKFFISSIESHGVVSGNCIQVEGGMYLAGESLIPTHNSELCSRILPAYLLGKRPTTRIISASYNADLSSKFNRDVQRIIDSEAFKLTFPNIGLNAKAVRSDKNGAWLRNKDEFEVVTYGGYYKNAGVRGGITGRSCDIAIIDDPVKGAEDAGSPTIRNKTWEWYAQDLCSRLHNDSQQLIIMTRWHEDDLAGRILASEDGKDWEVVVFPAIKVNNLNPDDPRKIGEPLWAAKHNLKRLQSQRNLGERKFQCLYQQDPIANKDLLVFPEWETVPSQEYNYINASEYFGLDFGFTDELALVGIKVVGMNLYLKEYLYESKLVNSEIAKRFEERKISKDAPISADSSRPEQITELNTIYGYKGMEKCVKGANSRLEGVRRMNEFKIHVTIDSKNLIENLQRCEYVSNGEGKPTDAIRDGNDHGLDAARYGVEMYMRKNRRKTVAPEVIQIRSNFSRAEDMPDYG